MKMSRQSPWRAFALGCSLLGGMVFLPAASSAPTELGFAACTLSQAQAAAVKASPEVAAAQARVDQAKATFALAHNNAIPAFFAGYAQSPQGNPPGPTISGRLATVGLQVTLGDVLAQSSAVRQASYALLAAQADEKTAEAEERKKLVALYFGALNAAAIEFAQNSALSLARAQHAAAQTRYRSGDVPRIDSIRAQVALARAQVALATAQVTTMNQREALQREMSPTIDAALRIVFVPIARAVPALSVDAAVRLARTARPEIAATNLLAKAATAGLRSARTGALPLVTVAAGYSTGVDSDVQVHGLNLNAQLTLPLSNSGHERITIAQAQLREAVAKAQGIERVILLDVAGAARSLAASEVVVTTTAQARELAAEELRAARLGYETHTIASLDLQSAQASYERSVIDEITARYDVEKSAALLTIGVGR